MDILQNIKASVEARGISAIDHFSIEKVGRKFYLYSHPVKADFGKIKIGRYNSYESAKKAVDTVLDLRLESYGS